MSASQADARAGQVGRQPAGSPVRQLVAVRRPLPGWLMPAVPAVAELAVGGYRIGGPSLWRDEAATIVGSQRRVGDIFALVLNADAVHGPYYLLMHFVIAVGGRSEMVLRLPSLIAMCLTVALTAALARRLAQATGLAAPSATGLVAGLALTAVPLTTRYAQEARPYALTSLFAALASYLLIRAAGSKRWPWWACYAAALALTGMFNLFAVLLAAAHGVSLVAARKIGPAGRAALAGPATTGSGRAAEAGQVAGAGQGLSAGAGAGAGSGSVAGQGLVAEAEPGLPAGAGWGSVAGAGQVAGAEPGLPAGAGAGSGSVAGAGQVAGAGPGLPAGAGPVAGGGQVAGAGPGSLPGAAPVADGSLARWLVACAAAAVLLLPMTVLSVGQSAQLGWITTPDLSTVASLLRGFAGSVLLIPVVAVLAVLGCAAGSGLRRGAGLTVAVLTVPWLVLPPVLLLAVSLVHPIYVERYVVFCLPALSVLMAAGLTWLVQLTRKALAGSGRFPARRARLLAVAPSAIAVAIIAVALIAPQRAIRLAGSRTDNLRAVASTLAANERRGDAIVYLPWDTRMVAAAYPAPFRALDDAELGVSPFASATLRGVQASAALVAARLSGVPRIWAVQWVQPPPGGRSRADRAAAAAIGRMRLIRRWHIASVILSLYAR